MKIIRRDLNGTNRTSLGLNTAVRHTRGDFVSFVTAYQTNEEGITLGILMPCLNEVLR
jgi:hypothetical protein